MSSATTTTVEQQSALIATNARLLASNEAVLKRIAETTVATNTKFQELKDQLDQQAAHLSHVDKVIAALSKKNDWLTYLIGGIAISVVGAIVYRALRR